MAFYSKGVITLLCLCCLQGSSGQGVTVTVEAGEGFVGFMKVLTCRYAWIPPCPNVNCTLQGIFWKKGSDPIGYLDHRDADSVTYYGEYDNGNYIISSMDISTRCDLTIQSVGQTDSGSYTCDVYTRSPGSISDSSQSLLSVRTLVPPSTITLDYNGMTYNNEGSIPVVAGDGRQFTCNTPSVYPQTTFTWIFPSGITTDQPLGTTTSSPNTDDTVDSSNTITVSIAENPGTSQLACAATNRQDGSTQPEIIITVTLQIKVPPKEVQLFNSDVELGDSLAVDQGTNYSLQCMVPATRPAASIQWLVSNVEPSTGVADPTSTLNNGLYDTSGSWSFTADRTHHKQEVKCVANTDESTVPYPEDTAIINVIGPPDTPLITPTSPVTENVTVDLTCTADMGYPDDWRLDWSGASLPGPTSTLNSPSDQRYSFANALEFTPTRQNNGETIKCTARRHDWTGSQPEGASVLNVQFCARTVSLTECPSAVQVGSTASLRCVSESSNPASILTWYKGGEAVTNPTDQSYVDGDYGGRVTEVTYTTASLNESNNLEVIMCCATNPSITCQPYDVCDACALNILWGPDPPTDVTASGKTSDSITVIWMSGYDGGEDQWFIVSYLRIDSEVPEVFSEPIAGGENTYTITGLEGFSHYEIRVYAENDVGRHPKYGMITVTTLPKRPIDVPMWFDKSEYSVRVEGLEETTGCIQLEVKYTGRPEWIQCGECIDEDRLVPLSDWCSQSSSRRRRRDTQEIDEVRARRCHGETCSEPLDVTQAVIPSIRSGGDCAFGLIIGIGIVIVLGAFLCGFLVGKKRRKENPEADTLQVLIEKPIEMQRRPPRAKQYKQETTPEVKGSAQYGNVSLAHHAFPRDQLKVIKELGHGAFGLVLLAEAEGIMEKSKVTEVAVKTVKDDSPEAGKTDLMRELDLMRILPGHPNVVKLLGFCIEKDPPYIIVEFLSKGNLKDLLKDSRSKSGRVYGNLHGLSRSFSSKDLIKFAKDVADGMAFISSQKCIHRDLAARNVLVAEDLTCKVSDFGLARDVMDIRAYEREKDEKLPLRWMALESFFDNVYTTMSDVWSYGVLLWEIVTLGSRPYPGMAAKTMIAELKNGYRMPKPQHCQPELYKIMLRTWEKDPESRPTFDMLGKELQTLMKAKKDVIRVMDFEEAIYEVVCQLDDNEKV